MHAKDNFIDSFDKDYKIIKIGRIKELVIKTCESSLLQQTPITTTQGR